MKKLQAVRLFNKSKQKFWVILMDFDEYENYWPLVHRSGLKPQLFMLMILNASFSFYMNEVVQKFHILMIYESEMMKGLSFHHCK